MASLSGISSSAVMGPPPPPPPTTSVSSASMASGGSGQYLSPMPNPSIHSSSSGPGSLNESALVEPLDYEEFVSQQQRLVRSGQQGKNATNDNILVDFPPDDIEVTVVPRKIRTLGHVLPEEPMYDNFL